jgi:NAD(P)H dehydrogenase (quinone)
MNTVDGPGPETQNRVGSFIGPMSASFRVNPPKTPAKGDLETAEAYGRRVATITLQFLKGKV